MVKKKVDKEHIADSLLYGRSRFERKNRAVEWLRVAYNAYCRLQRFRDMRAECVDYAYGRQYEKTIVVNGRRMSKEDYMRERGIPVLQNNILGKLKRVVQGQFRLNDTTSVCNAPDPSERQYAEVWSALLMQNMKLNDRAEKNARMFEEFLLSGMAIYKTSWAYRDGKLDAFTDYVNPNFAFWPHSLDFNLADIRFCGLLHDLDFSDVLAKFSRSEEDDIRLRDIFNHCLDNEYISSQYSTDRRTSQLAQTDFYTPAEYGKCRVIELWTKERRRAWFCMDPEESEPYYVPYDERALIDERNRERLELNIKRWPDGTPMTGDDGQPLTFIPMDVYREQHLIRYERRVELYWYYRYLSPDGHVLEEGVSPYWNGGESFHPFTFKPYPYIDGEFHPFIAEMIPAQDYFNYYLIALDFYVRNAAKGVLMVDENALTDQMSIEEMADQYIRTNGIILYTSKNGGRAPETKTANSIPGGFDYFIQLSRSLTEDVSGVQPALQGKREGNTSGVMYQAQISQASASILDLIRTFNSFLRHTDKKTVKVMQCFYTGVKSVSIAGEAVPYDMDTIADVDLDIAISEDTDSPVYRALLNQFHIAAVDKGQLPVRVALELGNFPGSARLMAAYDRYAEQMQAAMPPGAAQASGNQSQGRQ